MGDGFLNPFAKRSFKHRPQKLVIFNFIRPGNRCFLALLLQSPSGWRRIQSRSCRQNEYRSDPDFGIHLPSRKFYPKITNRHDFTHRRHPGHGSLGKGGGSLPLAPARFAVFRYPLCGGHPRNAPDNRNPKGHFWSPLFNMNRTNFSNIHQINIFFSDKLSHKFHIVTNIFRRDNCHNHTCKTTSVNSANAFSNFPDKLTC